MARMPGTNWQGEQSPGKAMSRYDIVCIHTIVGYAPAHAAHFSTHHDGRIDQSRDTRYQSGANLEGNPRIIAIENEDHGSAYGSWNVNDGHAVPAFTDAQVEAIAQVCAWAHQTHGIPLQPCPNSKPTSRGIAYHRQGIDGNFSSYDYGGRVSGGELWSESTGKVCPGDRRISQLFNEIIPRAQAIARGEDDVGHVDTISNEAAAKIASYAWDNNILHNRRDDIPDEPDGTSRDAQALIQKALSMLADVIVDVAAIKEKLNAPAPPPGTVTVGAISPDALAAQAKASANEQAARLAPPA